MSKEQGSLDESQLKPEDEILKDTPVEYEELEPLFSEEGLEGTEEEAGKEAEEKTEEKEPEEKPTKEPGSEKDAATAQPEGEKEATAGEDKKPEEKEPEDKKPEEGEDKKPPAGYVEIGALKEARGQLKELRESHDREIGSLRREIAALKADKEEKETEEQIPERFKTFKVLSEKEFDELAEENPIEAIKYQQTLRDYEKYTDGIRRAQEEEEAQVEEDREIIQTSMKKIGELIPGVYEKDSEIRETLTKFATDHGISRATLGVLTDPGTLVLPPGADAPVLLGDSAVELVALVDKIYKTTQTTDRAAIEKEVETRLRKEIQAELLKKLKAGSLGEEFKDIGELPSGEDLSEELFAKTDFTEDQWARLPEAKKRALLGG